jgi:hypothetical protein
MVTVLLIKRATVIAQESLNCYENKRFKAVFTHQFAVVAK